MKNAFSKSTLLAFSLILMIFPGLVSCKKDKHEDELSLREQLAGEWQITSFSIDDLEMMDLFLYSSSLEFDAYDGSEGDYQWLFVYTDGSSTNTSGVYEVDEDAEEITFDNGTDAEVTYDVYLDGGELELSGIVDGSRYELTLERY